MEEQQINQEISETPSSAEIQVKSESFSEPSEIPQLQENQPIASTSSNTPPILKHQPVQQQFSLQSVVPQISAQANATTQLSNQIPSAPTQTQTPTTPTVGTPIVPSVSQQASTASTSTPAVTSEWDEIRLKLQESPHKIELWIRYRDLAEDSGDLEKIKEAYEAMLEKYPNNVSFPLFTYLISSSFI